MLTHHALTTAPPTLVFVAHDTELLRLIAPPYPPLLVGEYVTLYAVADPTLQATYRVQRLQHRIPTHGALPPGTTFPLAAWEIVVHLVPIPQAEAEPLTRRQRLPDLQAHVTDLQQRYEDRAAQPLASPPPDPGGPTP